MPKYRLEFEKLGRVKYISHLDMMRTFQRAFRRAETPLKYSEGFNPHPLISLPMPLSLGTESLCELLDFDTTALLHEDHVERLNRALPEGVRVKRILLNNKKAALIAWLRAELTLTYDAGLPEKAVERLQALFARDSLVIRKKTKRGEGDLDLIPCIRALSVREGEGNTLKIDAIVSAKDPVLNPTLLAESIVVHTPELAPDFVSCLRLELFDGDLQLFPG